MRTRAGVNLENLNILRSYRSYITEHCSVFQTEALVILKAVETTIGCNIAEGS